MLKGDMQAFHRRLECIGSSPTVPSRYGQYTNKRINSVEAPFHAYIGGYSSELEAANWISEIETKIANPLITCVNGSNVLKYMHHE